MPTEREIAAFLARGQRVLERARRVADRMGAGKPIPEGTSEAVRIVAQLELRDGRRAIPRAA
jgi:hypothetical protein